MQERCPDVEYELWREMKMEREREKQKSLEQQINDIVEISFYKHCEKRNIKWN
jgi:hypothetical protein